MSPSAANRGMSQARNQAKNQAKNEAADKSIGWAAHIVEQLQLQPSPDWLAQLRGRLSEQLRSVALPSRRDENWKYTPLTGWKNASYSVALRQDVALAPEDLQHLAVPGLDCYRVVFVNGHLAPELSYFDQLPSGVRFTNMAGADVDVMDGLRPLLERDFGTGPEAVMANLNTAALADGLVLEVGNGVKLERPIHCLLLTTQTDQQQFCNLRNIIRVGAGASLTLVEHFARLGEPDHLTNVVNQFELGDSARLEHVRLQQEAEHAKLVTRQDIRQQADSDYRYFGFDLGGRLVRHDLNAKLEGAGANCQLHGAYALASEQHLDNHSRVDHVAANASSQEFFKGVLDGRARAVFNGKVVVHQGADGTDAQQTNNNLLLSKLSEVDTKPELEIYADDVKCAHGATVGQLDDKQLFYLRSRGIPEAEARLLLTYAFCREIVDTLDSVPLREFVAAQFVAHLPRPQALEEVT